MSVFTSQNINFKIQIFTVSFISQVKIWFQNRRTKWKKQDNVTNAEAAEHKTQNTPKISGSHHNRYAIKSPSSKHRNIGRNLSSQAGSLDGDLKNLESHSDNSSNNSSAESVVDDSSLASGKTQQHTPIHTKDLRIIDVQKVTHRELKLSIKDAMMVKKSGKNNSGDEDLVQSEEIANSDIRNSTVNSESVKKMDTDSLSISN